MPSVRKNKRSTPPPIPMSSNLSQEVISAFIKDETTPKDNSAKSAKKLAQRTESSVPKIKRGHQLKRSGEIVRRVTVILSENLGRAVAIHCLDTGKTMSEIVTEALESKLHVS